MNDDDTKRWAMKDSHGHYRSYRQRRCPQCGIVKLFRSDHTFCNNKCAGASRRLSREHKLRVARKNHRRWYRRLDCEGRKRLAEKARKRYWRLRDKLNADARRRRRQTDYNVKQREYRRRTGRIVEKRYYAKKKALGLAMQRLPDGTRRWLPHKLPRIRMPKSEYEHRRHIARNTPAYRLHKQAYDQKLRADPGHKQYVRSLYHRRQTVEYWDALIEKEGNSAKGESLWLRRNVVALRRIKTLLRKGIPQKVLPSQNAGSPLHSSSLD
jgi:hypothetical protein